MTCAGEVKKERKNKGEGGTWVVGKKGKKREVVYVGGGGKKERKKKKKKKRGYTTVGEGRKKMRKEGILGVVKKINK
jgi:hypothetical protein